MAFLLFIIVNAVLFVRPAELIPQLAGLPIYEVLILLCLVAAAPALLRHFIDGSLFNNPITICVLGLLPAIILSHLSHGRLGATAESAAAFARILVYYLLLITIIDSPRRLRHFLLWLACFTLIITIPALLEYHKIISFHNPLTNAGLVMHETQDQFDPETGIPVVLDRLAATGIFGNPNDMSRILAAGFIISLYALGTSSAIILRAFWLTLMGLFGYALNLTYSRGGLLALIAGLFALFLIAFGKRKTILIALVLLPLLFIFNTSRQTDISVETGTGQERVKLWSEGLDLFRESPIFGIGMNEFGERVGKVAHNSFVHCYTELGFFGGTLFAGAFYLALRGLYTRLRQPSRQLSPPLRRQQACILALVVATIVGMITSTRSYTVTIYLILGLATACLNLTAAQHASLPDLRFDVRLIRRLAGMSVLLLLCIYIYVRLTARFG